MKEITVGTVKVFRLHCPHCGSRIELGATDASIVALTAERDTERAEVERLRGWIALVNDSIQVSRDPWLQRVLAAAINGAEVPK